jgi:hypothetical protein
MRLVALARSRTRTRAHARAQLIPAARRRCKALSAQSARRSQQPLRTALGTNGHRSVESVCVCPIRSSAHRVESVHCAALEWSADPHGFRSFVAQMSALRVRWRLPPPVTTEQLQSSSRNRRAWRSGAKLYASLRLWRTRSTAVMWAAGTTRSRLGAATCRRHCTVTAGPHPSALLCPPPALLREPKGPNGRSVPSLEPIGRCVANQPTVPPWPLCRCAAVPLCS